MQLDFARNPQMVRPDISDSDDADEMAESVEAMV